MDTPEGYAPPRRRLGVGAAVVVVVLALVVTVVVGVVRGAASPTQIVPDVAAASGSPGVLGADLFVHVSGAVAHPGLYRLRDGARVVDAIAAAGGFAPKADRDGVNLARALSDGEQLVVPIAGASPAAIASAGKGGGRIDLNTATVEQLDTLPRIGPALAQRIVDWRTANGRFTSVDDLLSVPGIGDKMLESLRPLVTV